jgi:hypothetical protein
MQAITTRVLPPSNFRGPRIVAECSAHRRVYDYDHKLDSDGNHDAAANRLFKELGWAEKHTLAHGMAKNRLGVHVLIAR